DAATVGLSKELGPDGIRVNAVAPGAIVTDLHAAGGQPDKAERVGRATPLGRPGEPEEIANAGVWLRSEGAAYVTGARSRGSGQTAAASPRCRRAPSSRLSTLPADSPTRPNVSAAPRRWAGPASPKRSPTPWCGSCRKKRHT